MNTELNNVGVSIKCGYITIGDASFIIDQFFFDPVDQIIIVKSGGNTVVITNPSRISILPCVDS